MHLPVGQITFMVYIYEKKNNSIKFLLFGIIEINIMLSQIFLRRLFTSLTDRCICGYVDPGPDFHVHNIKKNLPDDLFLTLKPSFFKINRNT